MEFRAMPTKVSFHYDKILISPTTFLIDPNLNKRHKHPLIYFMFEYLSKVRSKDLTSSYNINFLMSLTISIILTSRSKTKLFNLNSLSMQNVPNIYVGDRKLYAQLGSQFANQLMGVMSQSTFQTLDNITKMGELISAAKLFSFPTVEAKYKLAEQLLKNRLASDDPISVENIISILENVDGLIEDMREVESEIKNTTLLPKDLMIYGNPSCVKNNDTNEIKI
jgi:hypothetical protein